MTKWLAVWRWLWGSTVEPNDALDVELPGVRVDPSGSYAHRRGEGDGPDTSFPS